MSLFGEIEKHFPILESQLKDEALNEFLSCPYEDLSLYHFSLGLYIRNIILRTDTALYDSMHIHGISHPDDMSSLIIRLFYVYMQTKRK